MTVFVLTNKAAMNTCVWTYPFISVAKIPRSGVTESDGRYVCMFIRNCHTICQSGHSTLHSHQQCVRVLVPTEPSMVSLFHLSPFKPAMMISHCGFNLHSQTANYLIAFCVCSLGQRFPTFLVPEISLVEESFSTGLSRGWFGDNSYKELST